MNKGCFTKKNAKKMGAKGGAKTLRKKGKSWYEEIGARGAAKRWKKALTKARSNI